MIFDKVMRGFMVLPKPASEMENDIQTLAGWGANIIRWQLVCDIEQASAWTVAEYKTWLDTQLSWLDGSLPYLKQYNVSVVLDLHTPVGGADQKPWGYKERIFDNDTFRAAYIDNWVYMATKYSNEDIIVAYDLLNEPGIEKSEKWQELAQEVSEKIRTVDTTTVLVVESIQGSPETIGFIAPLTNVEPTAYSVHMYLPNSVTFQGIPDANCNMIPIGAPYPSDTITKDSLIKFLKPVVDFQSKYQVPIYIGEYSCARWSGHPTYTNAYNYIQDCISIFETNKWSWTYHAFRESGIWELEYDTSPCPDKCNPNCVQAYQDTTRKQLMIEAFSKNSQD